MSRPSLSLRFVSPEFKIYSFQFSPSSCYSSLNFQNISTSTRYQIHNLWKQLKPQAIQVERNNVWRFRVNTIAVDRKQRVLCILELNTSVNNIKILNLAQRCFMTNLCHREQ